MVEMVNTLAREASQPPELYVVLAIVFSLLAMLAFWIRAQIRSARIRAWEAVARDLGWSAFGQSRAAAALGGFYLTGRRTRVGVGGIEGDLGPAFATLADVYMSKGEHDDIVTVCVVRASGLRLSGWLLRPVRMQGAGPRTTVRFPSDPAFELRYTLLAEDETAARLLFSPELRHWLVTQRTHFWLEARDDAFLFHRYVFCLPRYVETALNDARQLHMVLSRCASKGGETA
jgi:hypothetical protein